MRKNIKFSASIIIILSLMLGYTVYAEGTATTTVAKEKETEFTNVIKKKQEQRENFYKALEESKNNKEEINKIKEQNREQTQTRKEEFQTEVQQVKNELNIKREEMKTQLETMINSTKVDREAFKAEMITNNELAKTKITEMRSSLIEEVKKIKDENKKVITEKIVNSIPDLNTKITATYSEKINQIENVLVSVESRISKAESRGIDVTTAKAEVEKAKQAIATAREAISAQMLEVYTASITNDATLKTEIKSLRDTFKSDIKAVGEKVKLAHTAVKTTAVTLAQIPKIDEDTETEIKVEETNTTTNN